MWDKFLNGELYVDLNSKEEMNDFLNQCTKRGLRWASGDEANKGAVVKYFQNRMLVTYRECSYSSDERALLFASTEPSNKKIIKWSDYMYQKFTKADLRNGDIVKLRDGELGVIVLDVGVIVCQNGGWVNLDRITADLNCGVGKNDIVAVRRPTAKYACSFDAFRENAPRGKVVYDRNEIVEMTLEEVCRLLGKEIKIVK